MFVNFSIPLESLIQLMPEDTHFGYPITRDRGGTDSGYLVRNSHRGRHMIQEMIDLQVKMANCPAPGMLMIHTYVAHLLDGVNGVRYSGECEQKCATRDFDVFDYMWLWDCVVDYYRQFQVLGKWQQEQVTIPHGFWAQPAQTDYAFLHNVVPIADDVGFYTAGGGWAHADNWLDSEDLKRRFPTTLALHMGAGPIGPAGNLSRSLRAVFPLKELSETVWTVSDSVDGTREPSGWSFDVRKCRHAPPDTLPEE